jgi:hypothetical protein
MAIEIISQLKPKNNQTFGLVDANDIIGGYIQVETISDMEAFLSTNKLKEGMLCYVKTVSDTNHMYMYKNGTWGVYSGGSGGSTGLQMKVVDHLSDLNDSDLEIKGQVVFVNETSDLRYYNGSTFNSFSRIYIQDSAPTDTGGLWIDTTERNIYTNDNAIIKNLLQVISVLQEKVNRIEWAFDSELSFGDFANNKYYEYTGHTTTEPTYGTSVTEDATTAAENLASETAPVEPVVTLLPNGRHLCIKTGTYAIMQLNKDDFLANELLWCYDTQTLYIKDGNTNKLVAIGSTTTNTDTTMDGILTTTVGTGSAAKTRITGIEMVDVSNTANTYLIRVKDGAFELHDYKLDTNSLAGNSQVVSSGDYYSSAYFPISSDNTGNSTSPMIYINMVYCGNDYGKTDYNYCSHSFIELANLTNIDLNLKGLYLHYTERDTNKWISLPLIGVIKAGSTFLIRGAQCSYLNTNTTEINVSTYDMLWLKSSTYNNTVLDVAGDEAHSIWDSTNLLKMASNCALYISGEPSTDYYETTVLETSGPWNSLGCLKWYVDLVGIGSYNSVHMPAEASPISTNNNSELLLRYYCMDDVSQAIKSLTSRSNATDWTYINLANINSALDISDYRPRSSSENKNIFFDKHLLTQGAPNIVTCSFGHNAHTTRCFNWVSVGYYNEYIWFTETSGDYSDTANRFESFKSGDGRTSAKNWNNAIYDRIRWITTDGTACTTHKFIKDFTEPTAGTTKTYYYKVGRDGYYTEERSFTLRNRSDVIANGFNFVQHTDQQGFKGEEYETWKLACNYIVGDKSNHGYDFSINTGDIAQNGNRVNEWLDYFNAGNDMFKNTEQMYTVGNNDLCEVDSSILIDGSDTSKVNPIQVEYFFTFELPYSIPTSTSGIFVNSVYSFVYGNTYFLSMNSEITDTTRTSIYGDTTTNVYDVLKTWCDTDLTNHASDTNIKWKVAFCHEAPFSLVTANLIYSYVNTDLTVNSSIQRGGSHLNTVGGYWFSSFLQNNGFKMCIAGHKHTHAITRYLREDLNNTMKPIVYDSTYNATVPTYPTWYTELPAKEKVCCQLSNDNTLNYVQYITCQATGYKLISNKELPGTNIPWELDYYPDTQTYNSTTNTVTNAVNNAQLFPHYIIWNVGNGTETEVVGTTKTARDRIFGLPYKVVLTATPTTKWAYKYNTPILLSSLTKTGGHGSINPSNQIIVENL